MSPRIRRRTAGRIAATLAALALVAAGCGGGADPAPTGTTGRPLNEISYDPSQPWVVTAVDNHFHDSHPSPPLDPDAVLIIKNAGRNLHNVTIVGTGFSKDLLPGEQLTIDPIRDLLPPPGPYTLVCTYHASQAMQGTLRLAPN